MLPRSFTTLRSVLDDKEGKAREQQQAKKDNNTLQRAKQCCVKKIKVRPHFFAVKRREWDGALKRKSCLSVSEFFFFSGIPDWSRQKSADGEFSLFRFFCSGKRNEKPLRLEQQQSDKKPLRLEQQQSDKKPFAAIK